MALKKTLNGWVAEVRDPRNLRSNGIPITDLYIQYSAPDRAHIHYTGEGGIDIGSIYLPADPNTLDDIAKGIKAVAKTIREDWLKRSGSSDPNFKPPALGGDLNYGSD